MRESAKQAISTLGLDAILYLMGGSGIVTTFRSVNIFHTLVKIALEWQADHFIFENDAPDTGKISAFKVSGIRREGRFIISFFGCLIRPTKKSSEA